MANEENEKLEEFQVTAKIKLPLPDRVTIGKMLKLKELGIDIKDTAKLNETRSWMMQDLELLTSIAENVFDRKFKEDEALDLDPSVIKEALDSFLELRCGIVFQAMEV